MIEQRDTKFMAQALELAELGRGTVSPNPLVGAIVVSGDTVVGRGYHLRAGEEHAEVLALREAGPRARGGTLYVTLEPCCHHGKTPPCTDAIARSGIVRVVVAATDPNPLVCGQGAAQLREQGIDIVLGVLEEPAKKQNEAFFAFITTGRPFVTVKLAATLDGKIAATDRTSRWLSGDAARRQVHRMRSWSDAVMVGSGTVIADNPSLTVRDIEGADPLRVIIDSNLRTPLTASVTGPGTLFCVLDTVPPERITAFRERGAELASFAGTAGHLPLDEVLALLGGRDIVSLLCEGGASLASSFVREHLADKLVYVITPKLLGSGTDALGKLGIGTLADAIELTDIEVERFGDDLFYTGHPVYRDRAAT